MWLMDLIKTLKGRILIKEKFANNFYLKKKKLFGDINHHQLPNDVIRSKKCFYKVNIFLFLLLV